MPGCACSIQTFGDFLGFNPHCHIIISDGTFDEQGNFHITPYYDAHALEQLFRHKLLKMLLDKGAISQWHIDLLMSWHHGYYSNATRGKRRKLGLIDAEIVEIAGQEAYYIPEYL